VNVEFRPIGIIHSPYQKLTAMPIQPTSKKAKPATVEVFPMFAKGLKDLDGFSHVYLIYFLHKSGKQRLLVRPFLDTHLRGVFATRAPVRPNPIGLSLVRVTKFHGNTFEVAALDALDGTPLLDIKPYIPDFENPRRVRLGWLASRRAAVASRRSDSRFA
jgi:tRNA-Thr(GGU) m(6)t(6)A37 methyltransferase TsaA